MGHLALLLIMGLSVVNLVEGQADQCSEVAPCIQYLEGACVAGRRQVCVLFVKTAGCIATGDDKLDRVCIANDFGKVSSPFDATTGPLCKTDVPGGSILSFGFRDLAIPPASSTPRSVTVLGQTSPVPCSQYTSVCDTSNSDMKFDFQVGACPVVPLNCNCPGYTNVGGCVAACGSGIGVQKKTQTCSGSGCNPPLTTTISEVCSTAVVPCPTTAAPVVTTPRVTTQAPVVTPTRRNGAWSNWENEGPCTSARNCGPGTRRQRRVCNNPVPSGNGLPCQGDSVKTVSCTLANCRKRRRRCRRFRTRQARIRCRQRRRG